MKTIDITRHGLWAGLGAVLGCGDSLAAITLRGAQGNVPADFITLGVTVVLGGLALVPVSTLINSYQKRALAARARSWRTVDGTIVRSEIVTKQRGTRPFYTPAILYQFSVEGRDFEGFTFRFGDFSSEDLARAQTEFKAFPGVGPVRIHYNPADPDESVVDPRARLNAAHIVGSIFALIVLTIVAVSVIWLLA